MSNFRNHPLKELAIIGGLLSVAFLLLPISGVNISNNGAIYLHQADLVFGGKDPGLTLKDKAARGPVFPVLIALAFSLMGKSVYSALLVVRISFAAVIMLSYLVGRAYFGRAVGALTACLVLSSFGLNSVASSLDTDIVLPAFVLLFLLLYRLSLDKDSYALSIITGLCLGFSILTKESAALFAGLPFLLPLVIPGRRRELWKQALWLYLGLFVVVLPWVLSVTMRYGSSTVSLGIMNPEVQQGIAQRAGFDNAVDYWFHLLTIDAPGALFSYYQGDLSSMTPLAPLIVVSWLILLARAIHRRQVSDSTLVICAVLFLPLLLRMGDYPTRLGQTSAFVLLSYLAVAAVLAAGTQFLADRMRMSRSTVAPTRLVATALTAVLLVSYQLIHVNPDDVSTYKLWTRGIHGLFPLSIFNPDPFRVEGRFTAEQKEATLWLEKNASPGTHIATDGSSQEALSFFQEEDDPVLLFSPLTTVQFDRDAMRQESVRHDGHLVYLMTYGGFARGGVHNLAFFLVFQEDIISALNQNEADYLVISGKGSYLTYYLGVGALQ